MSGGGNLAVPMEWSIRSRLTDYVELTKPRLTFLVIVTAAFGYWLGGGAAGTWGGFAEFVVGAWLMAGGAAALNQVLERDLDAGMRRTATRPVAAGRLGVTESLFVSVAISLLGLFALWTSFGPQTAFLGALSLAIYVFAYTPLKTRTTFNTHVGAIVGALPPLMGWVAATGTAAGGGWDLFAVLFIWQLPHFLLIAWFCREDYERVGMKMLSVFDDEKGSMTNRQILWSTVVMVPISLLPVRSGIGGDFSFWTALVLGIAMVAMAVRLVWKPDRKAGRRLFLALLAYLPLYFGCLLIDRLWILT